ncbi:MAG: hypothetical protein JNK25_03430 [Phycisphaerae bacterium]|nr:hypothetical protein [Phycisphaerae bacterium]
MARLVGLSRSRFHQLLKEGFFPAPQKCPTTGRPFYDSQGQTSCLEIRRTHFGINGRTVMFYARRFGRLDAVQPKARPLGAQSLSARKKKSTPPASTAKPKHAVLIDSLRQLGLNDLSEQKVAAAVAEACPQGVEGQPHEAVLLAVFRHLVRQNSGRNVG